MRLIQNKKRIARLGYIERRHSRSYWASVIALVGHLIGTAVIFTALFSIGWAVSWILHALHEMHPFPDEIFKFVTRIEVYLVYVDATLSGIVLLAGMWRFCRDMMEES